MARNDPRILGGLAIVTGAGAGLGRALARNLAMRGMRVAGIGRNMAALNDTGTDLPTGRFHPIIADMADPDAVTRAFDQAREIAPLTLLINNAATYPRRDFMDETGDSFMATVATNLGGTVAASRAAMDQMAETGFGRILNVATFADIAPLPASSAYATSKGAQRIFTRALIADLADRFPDVVISEWMPGMLATAMGIPDGVPPDQAARWGAELALWHDPELTGSVFEMNSEILPPRGLKSKLKSALMLRRGPKPRVICQG